MSTAISVINDEDKSVKPIKLHKRLFFQYVCFEYIWKQINSRVVLPDVEISAGIFYKIYKKVF